MAVEAVDCDPPDSPRPNLPPDDEPPLSALAADGRGSTAGPPKLFHASAARLLPPPAAAPAWLTPVLPKFATASFAAESPFLADDVAVPSADVTGFVIVLPSAPAIPTPAAAVMPARIASEPLNDAEPEAIADAIFPALIDMIAQPKMPAR